MTTHAAELHLFSTSHGDHILIPNGSRVYDINAGLRAELETALQSNRSGIADLLRNAGLHDSERLRTPPLADPPVRSLSLAVSQSCNLACGYCYAEGGSFGKPALQMSPDIADSAIRWLFRDLARGDRAYSVDKAA